MVLVQKIGQLLINLINIIAAILTILVAVNGFDGTSYSLLLCVFLLIASTVIVYIRWIKEHSRLRALRILAHRGKIHTLNFLVYLDFLTHKFHGDYDNDPKTNSLKVARSEFTFRFKNLENDKEVDVDYKHTFHIIKHGKKFDVIVLHASGNLIRSPEMDGRGTGINYQEKKYLIIPEPCVGTMRNRRNSTLDRVVCALPEMEASEEMLEFYYTIKKESNLDEDEVFVIYPKNYGKGFHAKATFCLYFEKPYFADIQLLTLPYDSIVGGRIKNVAQFENKEEKGHDYECSVPSLKDENIYLISIRRKPPQ